MFTDKTDVKVRLRHKTVGCLYYLCMLGILGGYVVGYEYLIKGGWGNMVDFAGSLRATCKAATTPAPIDTLHYWCARHSALERDISSCQGFLRYEPWP